MGGRAIVPACFADQVYLNVRTLCHQLVAGSDPGGLRLWRAAEFSAPLQCGADAAGSGRANGRGQALVRADALGICSRLGEGPEDGLADDQRARRIGQRQAGIPQRHAPAALPRPRRRLLRLAAGRAAAPVFRAGKVRRAARLRRAVGDLDRPERRGGRYRRDPHHAGQPSALRHSRTHAGHRAAGGLRALARLRQCRSRNRRRSHCAGSGSAARMLRSLAGGEPRSQ